MIDFIEKIKSQRIFIVFYWFLKVTLGLTFIASGLRKMPGVKFTTIPIENPIGLFFEGMYATGFYWNFIGYYQIIVGLILMTKWWKSLTPLLLFPVAINIFLVSISLNMRGTPIITACMVLGNLFLILWHLKSYVHLLKIKE